MVYENTEHSSLLSLWEESKNWQVSRKNQQINTGEISSPPESPTSIQADPTLATPSGLSVEQAEDDPGFFDTLADMGKGLVAGVYDAVGETVNLASDGANLFMDEGNKFDDIMPGSEEFITVETGAGHITKTITQFALGFIGAGKFLKAAKLVQGAGKAAVVGRGMAQGAIADFTVFDGNEERLSNLIESSPTFANPITEFLAADGDDSAAVGRFKNVIEGMALGAVGEALVTMVRGIKATRAARSVGEAEDAVIHASDELEALAAKSGQSTEELAQSVEAVVHGDSNVLADAVSEAVETGNKVELNIHGVTPEDFIGEASHVSPEPLTPEGMGALVKDALAEGKSVDEILKGEYLIGNTSRLQFDSAEEVLLHGEYAAREISQTLKGQGVQTHQTLLRKSENWLESQNLHGLLEAAQGDKQTMQQLAERAIAYKIGAKSVGQRIMDLSRQIELHGSTPELAEQFEKASKMYQDLSLASKDVTTASARITSAGRIKPGYLDAGTLTNILKMADGDPEKVLKVLTLSRTRRAFDTVTEVVINGLLSSPKTHLINITSNFMKTAIMPAEKILGGAFMGNKQMVAEGVETYAGLFKYLGESWKACKMALKTGDNVLDSGHKILDTGNQSILNTYDKIKEGIIARKAAKGKNIAEGLSTFEELQAHTMAFLGLPSRALGGMDEMFKQLNYRANVYSKLAVEGATKFGNDTARIAEFVENGMKDAFESGGRGTNEAAIRYAQESTWTQNLREGAYFSGGMGQAMFNMVNTYTPLRLVAPFIRTPTNLIRDFVAHTPGLNMLTKRYRDAITVGGERAAVAHGQTATGALLWTTAIGLAASGNMTGGYPKDPATRQAWIDSGIEPYSFKIGDKYISFARVDPFSTLFGIAADYAEYTRNWADSAKGNFASGAVLALGENVLNKSYLTGVMDLLNALTDETTDSTQMQRFLQRAAVMFVPYSSGLRFTRQLTDDHLREVRGLFDSIMNALPGTSNLLPEKRSWITGEAISHNLFWGTHKDDTVVNEIAKLGDNLSIGAPGRKLKGVELDAEQYARLCELQGTIKIGGLTQHERLERLMKSPAYDLGRRKIPDMPGDLENPRTRMVEKVIDDYRKAAQKAILREDGKLRSATDIELKTRIAARRGQASRVQELLTMPK